MKKGLVVASLFALLMVLAAAPVFAGGYPCGTCAPRVAPAPVNLQLVMPAPPAKKCGPKRVCEQKKVTCYKCVLEPETVKVPYKVATPIKKVIEYTCWVPVKEKVRVDSYELGCAVWPDPQEKPVCVPDPCNPRKSLTCMKPVMKKKVVENWQPSSYWKWITCMKPVKCKRVCTVWEYRTEYQEYTRNAKKKIEVPCPPKPCAPVK
jgi:hypothetical protein